MLSKIIHDVLKQERGFLKKFKMMISLIKYYKNLQKGIETGNIYHKPKNQDSSLLELINRFSQNDLELMEFLFKDEIINFLEKRKLKQHIDFDEKIGTNQIGYNTIYVEKPIAGLWTTGKASFFLPTKKQLKNKFIIEFRSIPPINVTVRFEKTPIKNFSIPKLSSKKIEFTMDPSKIVKDISEITISTDKLWLPNVILEVEESLTIGIGVKSIGVSYF